MSANDRITKLPKWAQDHIAKLEEQVAVLKGLPEYVEHVERDLPPPKKFGELTRGWDFNLYHVLNSYGGIGSGAVEKYCSSLTFHGYGWEKTTSQQGMSLYSTEEKAWRALRAEFIRRMTLRLREIDKRVAAASKEEAP